MPRKFKRAFTSVELSPEVRTKKAELNEKEKEKALIETSWPGLIKKGLELRTREVEATA